MECTCGPAQIEVELFERPINGENADIHTALYPVHRKPIEQDTVDN